MTSGGEANADAAGVAHLSPDAVLCALVLLPTALSRNRFFALYEDPALRRVRKRAARLRALIRQILGQGREPAQIVGEQEVDDRVLLRMQIPSLGYRRTTSLTVLEASILRYALSRKRGDPLRGQDRARVERALGHWGATLGAAAV